MDCLQGMEIGCALEKDWIMRDVRRETVVCRRRMRVVVLEAIFLGFRGMKEEGEGVVSANMSEREVLCERRRISCG